MFSSQRRAERTTAQAWEYLSSAMAAAADSANRTGRRGAELADRAGRRSQKLANEASRRATAVGNEAWSRANAAADALAGRKPGRPWALILGCTLIGAALGWAAATTARAALERQAENEELELAETAVVVTPTYDD
jgi:hypothetical protein